MTIYYTERPVIFFLSSGVIGKDSCSSIEKFCYSSGLVGALENAEKKKGKKRRDHNTLL
jgi:hypothetical protein